MVKNEITRNEELVDLHYIKQNYFLETWYQFKILSPVYVSGCLTLDSASGRARVQIKTAFLLRTHAVNHYTTLLLESSTLLLTFTLISGKVKQTFKAS